LSISPWFWTLAAFASGSVPYSFLIGKLLFHTDIRKVGDGNPGATNVIRAGGRLSGGMAVLLDALKATIPVGLVFYGHRPPILWMTIIALAPLAGHLFTPWLGWRGGKGVSTTFGLWAALTLGEVPLILGSFMLLCIFLIENSGWAVMLSMLGVLGHLLVNHPDPLFFLIWIGNAILLGWAHRADLRTRPRLRSRWRRNLP